MGPGFSCKCLGFGLVLWASGFTSCKVYGLWIRVGRVSGEPNVVVIPEVFAEHRHQQAHGVFPKFGDTFCGSQQ